MTMQRPRIRIRRALWPAAAVLVVYLTAGFVSISLYQSGAMSSRWEDRLVFHVFLPVWLLCGGLYKSEFMGFGYRLETRRDGAVTRHDVGLVLDTSVVPNAPVLSSCVTRFPSRASLYAGRLPESTEAQVHLTQPQVKVVERAIRGWSGGRKHWHEVDDWAAPPNWDAHHPVLLFRADIHSDSWTGQRRWRGYQIEAFGPEECSAQRGLIQSINQALPASIRKSHALPLPPEKK